MIPTSIDATDVLDLTCRPKRMRHDSSRHYDASGEGGRTLELGGVIKILKAYDDYEGGINCSLCGKLYKSRVCFIKHIWEHSVYWEMFEGAKNQDRVLSIQAALILYSGYHGVEVESSDILMDLLVTAPNGQEGKSGHSTQDCKGRPRTPKKRTSPLKRKRSCDD